LISVEFFDAATASILDQADYFASVANPALSQRWLAAVDSTVIPLRRFPNIGRPCFFRHPELQDVRRIGVDSFRNYLLFYRYVKAAELILIIDVVHGARDLEAWLAASSRR